MIRETLAGALMRLAVSIEPPLLIIERVKVPADAENVRAFKAPNRPTAMPYAMLSGLTSMGGHALAVRALTVAELTELGRICLSGDEAKIVEFIISTATGLQESIRRLRRVERIRILRAAFQLSEHEHGAEAAAAVERGAC